MRKYYNKLFYLYISIYGLFSLVVVIVPIISATLLNNIVQNNYSNIFVIIIIYVLFSIFQFSLSSLSNFIGDTYVSKMKNEMRLDLINSYYLSDYSKINDDRNNEIISFINNNIPAIASDYLKGLGDIVNCVILIVFSSLALLEINVILALVIILMSILIVELPKLFRDKGAIYKENYLNDISIYNNKIQYALNSIPISRLFRSNDYVLKQLQDSNQIVYISEQKYNVCSARLRLLTGFLQITMTSLIILIGINLISKNEIGAGDLLATIQISSTIAAPIEVLSYLKFARNSNLPIVNEFNQLINTEKYKFDWNNNENIILENVSYEIDNKPILKSISYTFENGKKYLIIGESGSGKSTLGKLLVNLITPTSGNLYSIKNCGVVLQNSLFVYASAKDNVTLGRKYDKNHFDEIINQLKLNKIIDYSASELTNLSGGEKQRICVARSLLLKHDFYLLDEATSSIDEESSTLIENIFLNQKATIIHISHKTSQFQKKKYDKILKMENGELYEIL